MQTVQPGVEYTPPPSKHSISLEPGVPRVLLAPARPAHPRLFETDILSSTFYACHAGWG